MASGASSNLNRELWKPETFSAEHGEQPTGAALINCRKGSIITNALIRDFWNGFEKIESECFVCWTRQSVRFYRQCGTERCCYDGHDRMVDSSIPTQASSLRLWIRCFTTIISAWWNLTSSNLKKLEAKLIRKTRTQKQLFSESGFVRCVACPSLSRGRRIKMKKLMCSRSAV